MGTTSRRLIVEIVGDSSSLEKAFARSSKSASKFNRQITGQMRTTRGAFAGLSGAAAALGVSFGAAGLVSGIKGAVDAASDLNEEINKSTVIFGDSGQELIRWSKTTANAIGLSQRAALEGAGGFGGMFKAIGIGEQQSAKMSQSLVQLAADMASMQNQDPSEMLDKLRSGLAGEAEPLRRFAVFIDEASVKQEAYRTGIAKVGSELTQQQKIQARYALIMRQAAFQMGDFANTSKSWANVQRRVRAIVEDTAAKIGADLTPKLAEAGDKLAIWLSDSENQERVQRDLTEAVKAVTAATKGFVTVVKVLKQLLGPVVDLLGGTENAVKALAIAFGLFKGAQLGLGIAEIAGGIGKIGRNADGSLTKVGKLRVGLLRLVANPYVATIAIVAIGAELVAQKIKNLQQMAIAAETQTFDPGSHLETTLVPRMAKQIEEMKRAGKTSSEIIATLRDQLGGSLKADDLITEAFTFQTGVSPELNARIGKAVQATKKQVENTVKNETKKGPAAATREQRNTWFDQMISRLLGGVEATPTGAPAALDAQIARLRDIAARLTKRIAVTKDITRKLNLEATLQDVLAQAWSKQQEKAQQAAAAIRGALDVGVARAGLTDTLSDNITAQQKLVAYLHKQVAATHGSAEAWQDFISAQGELNALQAEAVQQREEAIAARQFRALGLGPTGEELTPGVKALQKQAEAVRKAIAGSFLDTRKTRGLLAHIRTVLAGGMGQVGEDVRAKINEILTGIRDDLKKQEGFATKYSPASPKAIMAALGFNLTTAQQRQMRAVLAQLGPGGTVAPQQSRAFALAGGGGVTIHGDVHVHGVQDVAAFENQLAKRQNARAHIRRGAR